jgi:hypothetical protein
VTLWHVAFATRVDAILREGIVGKEHAPVFAFTDQRDAERWAGWMQWTASSNDDMPHLVVIVEFDADPNAWEVASDRTLDVLRSSVVLREGSVPPTAIRHVEVLVSASVSRMAS